MNFAAALSLRKQQTVLVDLDSTANDCAMQLGCAPQHSLRDVGENMSRMDPALFEGLAVRDPMGFYLIGPPDQAEPSPPLAEATFRDFVGFLVEKYEAVVVDGGRWIADEVVLSALRNSSMVFLVLTQQFPAVRNAQRYIAALAHLGFHQDQIKIVVNQYLKRPPADLATLDQIRQTLNQPVFFGIPSSPTALAAVNRGRPFLADRAAAGDLAQAFRSFLDKVTGPKQAPAQTEVAAS